MPLPHDFDAESLYLRDHWFVHDLVSVDPEARTLHARTDTTQLGGFVDAQRTVSGHAKHLPAAIAIQITGTLGQLYAVYALGLRATEGWCGYGTHIKDARFGKMGLVGPPLELHLSAHKQRRFRGNWFVEFTFRFEQEGEDVYRSNQWACWMQQEACAAGTPPLA